MSYIPIETYPRKWIFTHQALPLPQEALARIKPMTAERSAQLWKAYISKQSPDAERLTRDDWPSQAQNWQQEVDWMSAWESDDMALPVEIQQHMTWQDDVTVYFCYDKYQVIETQWQIFKQHWKNFLFFDDGPILIGRRRSEALWFHTNGQVKIGKRIDEY